MDKGDAAGSASTSNVGPIILEESTTPMSSDLQRTMEFHACCSHSEVESTTTTAEPGLSSSPYFSARIQRLSDLRNNFPNQVEFEIESSKSHWTELSKREDYESTDLSSDDSDNKESNSEAFERLKEHAEWGPFFRSKMYDLKIGKKIAEGGQAVIFAASGTDLRHGTKRGEFVVKAFKKGYFLQDLQRMWPRRLAKAAMTYRYVDGVGELCWAVDVQLLEGDRFAFVFPRHWGDLRKLIDMRMLERNGMIPPFSPKITLTILLRTAEHMHWLHMFGFLHKDLKAANILLGMGDHETSCYHKDYPAVVADFESSVGIAGTGFWRALEILLALKNHNFTEETFTPQADVGNYAMTCYEVITGCVPFEGHGSSAYDGVTLR